MSEESLRLGWNTSSGMVYCALCDWKKQCYNLEQIEHCLKQHLEEAHDRTLNFRTDEDTGQTTMIP